VDEVLEPTSVYTHPELYDIAFGYRDIPREVDFIEAAFARYCARPMKSALDLACGTAPHGIELARRGKVVTAIDRSPAMLDYAAEKAEIAGVEIDLVQADICDFELDRTYDCAVCMLNSLAYLTDNRQFIAHFACVARALAPDGIYVVELANPRSWVTDPPHSRRERWDAQCWTVVREGTRVRATLYRDPMDLLTETARIEMTLDITQRGTSKRIHDVSVQRVLFPQGLAALAAAGGRFRLAGYFEDFDLESRFTDGSRTNRMIGVFLNTRRGKEHGSAQAKL